MKLICTKINNCCRSNVQFRLLVGVSSGLSELVNFEVLPISITDSCKDQNYSNDKCCGKKDATFSVLSFDFHPWVLIVFPFLAQISRNPWKHLAVTVGQVMLEFPDDILHLSGPTCTATIWNGKKRKKKINHVAYCKSCGIHSVRADVALGSLHWLTSLVKQVLLLWRCLLGLKFENLPMTCNVLHPKWNQQWFAL